MPPGAYVSSAGSYQNMSDWWGQVPAGPRPPWCAARGRRPFMPATAAREETEAGPVQNGVTLLKRPSQPMAWASALLALPRDSTRTFATYSERMKLPGCIAARIDGAGKPQHAHVLVHANLLFARHHQVAVGQHVDDGGRDGALEGVGAFRTALPERCCPIWRPG